MAENGEKRSPTSHRTPGQVTRQVKGYDATPKKIEERSMRNKARRKMEAKGLVKKGDGKDVDHKKPVRSGGSNADSNLKVVSASKNRAWRTKG
jgi:hypothetical protein